MGNLWKLSSFASGGIPKRPPGYQFVLWETEAKINGLVAADLNTLVSHVIAGRQHRLFQRPLYCDDSH